MMACSSTSNAFAKQAVVTKVALRVIHRHLHVQVLMCTLTFQSLPDNLLELQNVSLSNLILSNLYHDLSKPASVIELRMVHAAGCRRAVE